VESFIARSNKAPMNPLDVSAEQNARPRTGDHDSANPGLGVERAEGVSQLGIDLERQRIQNARGGSA